MAKYLISSISYDATEEQIEEIIAEHGKNMYVNVPNNITDDEELNNFITEYISNETGYCINSYVAERYGHIHTSHWHEEISEICNDIVNTIEETLNDECENKELVFTKKYQDQSGDKIQRIYYDEDEEDVLMDTESCKGSRLREEPINILLDVAEAINWIVYGVEPF